MYSGFSISYYCKLFGKSRQAFYEQKNEVNDKGLQDAIVLRLVNEIRVDLPECGTDKLYHRLKASFEQHGVKLGRDGYTACWAGMVYSSAVAGENLLQPIPITGIKSIQT